MFSIAAVTLSAVVRAISSFSPLSVNVESARAISSGVIPAKINSAGAAFDPSILTILS